VDWYSISDLAFSALTDAEVEALLDGTPTTVDATTLTWYTTTDFQHGLLTDLQYTTLGDGRAPIYTPFHVVWVGIGADTPPSDNGWTVTNLRIHVL